MRNIFMGMAFTVGMLSSLPAWSWGCDGGSSEPQPAWVSRADYSEPGYYVGVGSADKAGKSKDEQIKASENSAKSNLVESIEVTIHSENKQSTRVNNKNVQMDAQSNVEVKAAEILRGLQIKGRWIDKDSCTVYTLVTIKKDAVKQAKREKSMKGRIDKFKALLAKGTDSEETRDIKVRRKYLLEAQALLEGADFALLPEEGKKETYAKKLAEALALTEKETSQVKGRMALFAINKDGILREEVIGKMLEQLKKTDSTADRLTVVCNTVDDCIKRANERGFSKLALLNASTQVETTQMGSLKGTLNISRTVYDIDSHKVLKGPDRVSTQMIGWSNEELDWVSAAEKAIREFK